jgi:hypothetical protein
MEEVQKKKIKSASDTSSSEPYRVENKNSWTSYNVKTNSAFRIIQLKTEHTPKKPVCSVWHYTSLFTIFLALEFMGNYLNTSILVLYVSDLGTDISRLS